MECGGTFNASSWGSFIGLERAIRVVVGDTGARIGDSAIARGRRRVAMFWTGAFRFYSTHPSPSATATGGRWRGAGARALSWRFAPTHRIAMETRTNEYGQPIGPALPDWTPRPLPPRTALVGRHARIEPV